MSLLGRCKDSACITAWAGFNRASPKGCLLNSCKLVHSSGKLSRRCCQLLLLLRTIWLVSTYWPIWQTPVHPMHSPVGADLVGDLLRSTQAPLLVSASTLGSSQCQCGTLGNNMSTLTALECAVCLKVNSQESQLTAASLPVKGVQLQVCCRRGDHAVVVQSTFAVRQGAGKHLTAINAAVLLAFAASAAAAGSCTGSEGLASCTC